MAVQREAKLATGGNGDGDGAPVALPATGAAVETIDIVTPTAGESITEGTILEWLVSVGEAVAEGQTVVEISTDKVDVELPAPANGTITELLAAEGDTVGVGHVIGRMTTGGAIAAPSELAAAAPAAEQQVPAEAPAEAPDTSSASASASPVARRAAAAHGVELSAVTGSGPAGRITKADVLDATAGDGAAAAVGKTSVLLRGAAAKLAQYMDESRSIPTATSFRTITTTTLEGRRLQLKEGGQKVSFTHLIAYAIAEAATSIPAMARHFEEVDGRPHRIDDGTVNLGLAVDVEKRDGSRTLMVPVIRDAAALSFAAFVEAYDALVEKARTGALSPDDLTGANITLTNPGGIGTVASVPRLMAGQGTIVATGAISYPPGLAAAGPTIGAEHIMTMTSTYDHRIIQGAESGRFLKQIDQLLAGEDGFYEHVFESVGVALGPAPAVSQRAVEHVHAEPASLDALKAVQAASELVKAHRTFGHLAAQLDPLGSEPVGDPSLDPEPLGLSPAIMATIPAEVLRIGVPGATFAEALPHLRETYCGTIAYEIEHISSHSQRSWLQEKIESGEFRRTPSAEEQRALLRRLIEVDAFERFLHKAYLGQKQFSIEGLDMTVPMLDELIQLSAGAGAREVVIGMAHRGRLNVLAHNLGRAYETIFAEFEGASNLEAVTTIPQGGTGDVKYHHGAEGTYELDNGSTIRVMLESNPSHLEYVSPVVEGVTRALQTERHGPHAHQDTNAVVPILIHGDASFPGQGVVAETLNLQMLDGYKVGGTVHLISNNQIGFTTDPDDARTTRWASDLAKGYDLPIIHVNADDVAACSAATRLAFAFREEFGHDVLIDLIGYRRYGHSEADEPAYTQPELYAAIKSHKRVWELWAEQLRAAGLVSSDDVRSQEQEIWDTLTKLHHELKARIAKTQAVDDLLEQPTGSYDLDQSPSPDVVTAVSSERLVSLNEELLRVPEGFTVHPKLVRQLERRREAMNADAAIDWGHAEALAYASLLTEGTPIRLTGQDTERGTFSQRHLVLHDANTGGEFCPIQNLPGALAPFELHNSPLSEMGCLGFEYGYSQAAPETLVLWEAQYGDFVNAAQVIVDQFIVSGLAKWGQTSRLVLLLPHGYEGSGPEHSSARLERFLQLAAEGNIRVANPTTPAQYFHLLRRQARIAKERPLIMMTPKSLLRLHQATSDVADLANDQFHAVLAEPDIDNEPVTRLLLCSGKIYYDLVSHVSRPEAKEVAIGRVELLYPFPEAELIALIDRYPNLHEVVWTQEEPRNMGARAHMSQRLRQLMPDRMRFGYIGRPERASPGVGYPPAHAANQVRILRTALDTSVSVSQFPRRSPGQR